VFLINLCLKNMPVTLLLICGCDSGDMLQEGGIYVSQGVVVQKVECVKREFRKRGKQPTETDPNAMHQNQAPITTEHYFPKWGRVVGGSENR